VTRPSVPAILLISLFREEALEIHLTHLDSVIWIRQFIAQAFPDFLTLLFGLLSLSALLQRC